MVDTFAKLKALNKHTEVYCGHEYTIANLQFALSIDPTNEALVAKYEWGNNTTENCMACVGKMAHKALTFCGCCCCLLLLLLLLLSPSSFTGVPSPRSCVAGITNYTNDDRG